MLTNKIRYKEAEASELEDEPQELTRPEGKAKMYLATI